MPAQMRQPPSLPSFLTTAGVYAAGSSGSESHSRRTGLVVAGKYKLGRKLGSGSFGDIYHGRCPYVFIRTLASFAKPREVLLVHGSDVGVHISTNEEVAVKLVRPHTDAHYQDHSRAVPLTQVSGRVRAGVSVGWQLLCSA